MLLLEVDLTPYYTMIFIGAIGLIASAIYIIYITVKFFKKKKKIKKEG
ncbi:MAG: hypothetical protein ACTSPD_05375 [Promethearchaeota archaeon]